MPRRYNNTARCRANRRHRRRLRNSSSFPLYEALDIVGDENRRLVQLVQQLRERIKTLEEEVERRQEKIVEGVENHWRREVQYERLLKERNRLRARIEDLEE
ncbi:6908_t:CDS:2, partial [Dentiscutata heterogama]